MKYNIANIIVEYDCKYNMLKERSNKYLITDNLKTDLKLFITDEDIEKEKINSVNMNNELCEYCIMGTTFYNALIDFFGCMFHSSCVAVNDEAYLFSAPSGTGKSTHTSLWLKYLKDKSPYILNDDKPAIKIENDQIWVYGTPFSGKNDININKRVKAKGICFIERSKINHIRKVEPQEAIKLFLEQTVIKINKNKMIKLLDILDIIIKKIPIYKLYCDMSEEAVKLAYQTMKGENIDEN